MALTLSALPTTKIKKQIPQHTHDKHFAEKQHVED
jgi:hypothetical protein